MLDKVIKQKLVVIGNGMAGMRTVEALLKRAPDLYDITVFGAEPYGNYNRILLSPVLAGEKTVDDIMLNTAQWYDDNNITLHKGETVTMIDRRTCEVVTADGARVPYDRLLIATGSNPFMLPLPGKDLPGVIAFRDIADVERMVEASTQPHARRRDRRRPARPGGRQRPDAARHERHRRASARHADGAPARSGRRRIAAQVARRARHGVQDAGADRGDPRRGPRHRRALRRRRRACRPISS